MREAAVGFPLGMARRAPGASCGDAICLHCGLRRCCLPDALSDGEIEDFSLTVLHRRRLARGEVLCRSDQAFGRLYLVQGGLLASKRDCDEHRIVAFHIPGDAVGLEGVHGGRYRQDVVALEESSVCALDFVELSRLAATHRGLHARVLGLFSRAMVACEERLCLLTRYDAERRVAAFLLQLAQRYHALGAAPDRLVLRMRQTHIASYLGLRNETISRAFSELSRRGLIVLERRANHRREVSLDVDGLARVLEIPAAL